MIPESPHRCIVGIGSNIDPEANIARLVNILMVETEVIGISSMVKTPPIGITNQADFINGAIELKTTSTRHEFREYLKQLEDRLGRDRSQPKFGPRTMDLDIVVWDGEVVDEDYHTRDFLRKAVGELGFNPET